MFHEGMMVRIVGNCNGSVNKVGEVGVIVSERPDLHQTWQVQVGNRKSYGNWTRETDMVPVQELTERDYDEVV